MFTCICGTVIENHRSFVGHRARCVIYNKHVDEKLNLIDKEEFTDLYINQGQSIKDLSNKYNLIPSHVYRLLKKFNIKSRTVKESWNKNRFKNKMIH